MRLYVGENVITCYLKMYTVNYFQVLGIYKPSVYSTMATKFISIINCKFSWASTSHVITSQEKVQFYIEIGFVMRWY